MGQALCLVRPPSPPCTPPTCRDTLNSVIPVCSTHPCVPQGYISLVIIQHYKSSAVSSTLLQWYSSNKAVAQQSCSSSTAHEQAVLRFNIKPEAEQIPRGSSSQSPGSGRSSAHYRRPTHNHPHPLMPRTKTKCLWRKDTENSKLQSPEPKAVKLP